MHVKGKKMNQQHECYNPEQLPILTVPGPYAGIGSRKTPADYLQLMSDIAAELGNHRFTLRSGGAIGADQAFERGCDSVSGIKEIYRPAHDIRPWAFDEAKKHIPKDRTPFGTWKLYTQCLIARNMQQVLGKLGDDPVRFVICWTPPEALTGGGTGYAIRCALSHGIPVYNLNDSDAIVKFILG